MNDDLRRTLEEAGSRPVPDARPEFRAALEERLLAVARTPAPAPPPAPSARVRRRLAFGFASGLAGAAALVAIAIVFGTLGARTSPDLELTEAVNVEVALSDGTTLVDPDGLLLPDGSVIRVGAGGSARIGDVVLRAGDVATVDAGRLQVQPGSEASRPISSGPTAGPPTASAPPATRAPTPTTTVATPRSSPSPSLGPTMAPPTARPDATASPTAPPGSKRSPSPSAATAGPGSPTPSAATVAPLKLVARAVGPSEVNVAWTGARGAHTYRLVAWVWRAGDGAEPVRSARRIVGEFTRPPDPPLAFRVGVDVVRIRLLVIAFTADGTELTRSNFALVSLGG